MSVLLWIAVGLIGGVAGGLFLRQRGRSLVSGATVGVLGALLGGFTASVLLGLDVADFDPTSVLVAAMGTVLLLLVLYSLPATDVFE